MRTAIRYVVGTFARSDRALLVNRLRDGRAAKPVVAATQLGDTRTTGVGTSTASGRPST
jgi:hypothetical protein